MPAAIQQTDTRLPEHHSCTATYLTRPTAQIIAGLLKSIYTKREAFRGFSITIPQSLSYASHAARHFDLAATSVRLGQRQGCEAPSPAASPAAPLRPSGPISPARPLSQLPSVVSSQRKGPNAAESPASSARCSCCQCATACAGWDLTADRLQRPPACRLLRPPPCRSRQPALQGCLLLAAVRPPTPAVAGPAAAREGRVKISFARMLECSMRVQ